MISLITTQLLLSLTILWTPFHLIIPSNQNTFEQERNYISNEQRLNGSKTIRYYIYKFYTSRF